METFDPDRYDVVGIALTWKATNHSKVLAIGVVNRSSGVFTVIPPEDRYKVFPSKGYVFAFDLFKHHPNFKNQCICLCAKPNNNENIIGGEDYVWDWKDDPYIFTDKLISITGPIQDDGEINYSLLKEAGIVDNKEQTYFVSGERIFRYDPGQRLMPFWFVRKLGLSYFSYEGSYLLVESIEEAEDGKVDLTTDEQLIEWYKKKVLRKEWNIIYEAKDFDSVDTILSTELKTLNIPTNVFASRLSRIQTMASNLTLTYEELEDLSTALWFKDIIQESMEKYSDQYISKLIKGNEKELLELKNAHEKAVNDAKAHFKTDIDTINSEISVKKEELANLSSKIEEETKGKRVEVERLQKEITTLDEIIASKQEALEKINSRKDSIIEDFTIIKDVLGAKSVKSTATTETEVHIESTGDNKQIAFLVVAPFRKNLESYLINRLCSKIDVDEIVTKLARFFIVLLPDDETISAIIDATGKCKYVVEYTGVDWKSFSDLWMNGLGALVNSAYQEPDIIHYLVLKNINMSYILCFLQPIIDMQNGLLTSFPGTETPFPDNLRILCTRTADNVIPVTTTTLKNIGCVTPGENATIQDRKKKAETLAPTSFVDGFLTVPVFTDLPEDDRYIENDSMDSYIDE